MPRLIDLPRTPDTTEAATAGLTILQMADEREWNEMVRADSAATFAHLAGWREILETAGGHETRYRVARDRDGRLAGLLPLARLRSRIFGQHLVSIPFLNYGGPLGSAEARNALVGDAVAQAEALGGASLVLRTRQAEPGSAFTARKVTVLLDLAATSDEMWERRFNAKLRTKIKRPARDGMQTSFGIGHLGAFYDVWSRNMRDLGTPVLPFRFFEAILAVFPDLVMIGATYHRERPVAAGFGFVWRDEFEMTWSSSLREFGAAKPNMMLYWDFMRELIARRVRVFNFGRSTPGSGPHAFKQAWGGIDVMLPWIQLPAGDAAAGERGGAMQIAAGAWRRLPLAVANRLGPAIAPHLPWW